MILSMSEQTVLFLTTVAAGVVMGFVYDLFRIIRKSFPHNSLMVQFEDIIYWAAVSFLMFYFMLHRNYGEIRFFSIVGAALGMIIYFFTFSVLIMKVAGAVIDVVQRVLLAVLRILLWPFKVLLRLLLWIFKPPIRWLGRKFRKQTQFVKLKFYAYLRKVRRHLRIVLRKV